jgi:transcription antitermination factor NusG
MTYHVLRVRGGSERAVKDRLERRDIEGAVPCETIVAVRRGRKISFERALISRYVFSRGDLGEAVATPGVHGPLRRPDKEPVTVSAEAVEALCAPIKPVVDRGLRKGMRAKVLEGPFAGFLGKISALLKGRATIEVDVFGRPTPVEIRLELLEAT